jgi:hypothetical protein
LEAVVVVAEDRILAVEEEEVVEGIEIIIRATPMKLKMPSKKPQSET